MGPSGRTSAGGPYDDADDTTQPAP
jgi:hypothetical protein